DSVAGVRRHVDGGHGGERHVSERNLCVGPDENIAAHAHRTLGDDLGPGRERHRGGTRDGERAGASRHAEYLAGLYLERTAAEVEGRRRVARVVGGDHTIALGCRAEILQRTAGGGCGSYRRPETREENQSDVNDLLRAKQNGTSERVSLRRARSRRGCVLGDE